LVFLGKSVILSRNRMDANFGADVIDARLKTRATSMFNNLQLFFRLTFILRDIIPLAVQRYGLIRRF